jgi:hypothetical protein
MPMKMVTRSEPISKAELHRRLQVWMNSDNERQIGDLDVQGRTPWIWIKDGSDLFRLHSDTKREGVADYLGLANEIGSELEWTVISSQKGNPTKVAFGPNKETVRGFYLYVD